MSENIKKSSLAHEKTKRKRRPSEVLKRGYSDAEISDIYALGKRFLLVGNFDSARHIFKGLSEIAPDYFPALIALSYCSLADADAVSHQEVLKKALLHAKQALRVEPRSTGALLYLVCILLSLGDRVSAGSYLGEVKEQIESGSEVSSELRRLYQGQLARFQTASAQQTKKAKRMLP